MSEEEVQLTGKAKKAKRSEERFKKGKKQRRDEAGDDNAQNTGLEPSLAATEAVKDESTKSKKRKRTRDETGDGINAAAADVEGPDAATADGAKSQKRKKSKPSNAAASAAASPTATGATTSATTKATPKATATEGDDADVPGSKQRFIVFIGNLPFTATTETITAHFASITPTSIRHLTDPATKKSKGYAFLEFANYDRMKTCLKLYHHSMFDSGVGGERGQRRINVELTAGGGGNTGNRKEKLKVKNTRLEEQRKRRAEAEKKDEARKAKKKGGAAAAAGKDGAAGGPKKPAVHNAGEEGVTEGMHPARMAMLSKGR